MPGPDDPAPPPEPPREPLRETPRESGPGLPPLESRGEGALTEEDVVRWVLDLGGEALVTGRNFSERHLVREPADLPRGLTSIVGLRLPRREARVDRVLEVLASSDRCGALTHLDLRDTPVSAAGLRQVVRFAFLERLDLSDTEVTRDDVRALRELANLQAVDLEGTDLAHLEFSVLFGQREVQAPLRHPLATAQRGLARAVDLALAGTAMRWLDPHLGHPHVRLVEAVGEVGATASRTPGETFLVWAAAGLLAVAALALAEVVLFPLVRATPGKLLMRVRVVTEDGGRPSPWAALRRAGVAATVGLGLGVPPVSWLLELRAGRRLWGGERAPWDRLARTRVVPSACPAWRTLLALTVWAAAIVLRP